MRGSVPTSPNEFGRFGEGICLFAPKYEYESGPGG